MLRARSGRDAVKRRSPRAETRGLRRTLARRVGARLGRRSSGRRRRSRAPRGAARAFDLDDVAKRAEELAREPFRAPRRRGAATGSREISYDQWRDIRFRPDRALWRDAKLPFQVQFFHPGLFYDRTVRVHVVDAEGVHAGALHAERLRLRRERVREPRAAGPRLRRAPRSTTRSRRGDYLDEVIVFLGASYFRAVGRDHVYGLSARGLAVDTASPSGEEFPVLPRVLARAAGADARGRSSSTRSSTAGA